VEYDWEKIFESKTNKELYDIVTRKVVLSKEAIDIAKQELSNRGFDFNNMDANYAAWQMSALIKEAEEDNRIELSGSRLHIPLKTLPIVILIISLLYLGINNLTSYTIPMGMAIYLSLISIVVILLNNYQMKKLKQNQKNRIEKIKELKEKLDKENLLNENSHIRDELVRQRIEDSKQKTRLNYIMIISLIIGLIIYYLLIKTT